MSSPGEKIDSICPINIPQFSERSLIITHNTYLFDAAVGMLTCFLFAIPQAERRHLFFYSIATAKLTFSHRPTSGQ